MVTNKHSSELNVSFQKTKHDHSNEHDNIQIIIIIGIQPLGRYGQRPELSQSTGIALVRCILGKFLGVVCHCFPQYIQI